IVPYSNWFLSLLSKKWKDYYRLRRQGEYKVDNRNIRVLAVPGGRKIAWLQQFFIILAYKRHRKRLIDLVGDNKIELIHAQNVNVGAGFARMIYRDFHIPYVVTTRALTDKALGRDVIRSLKGAKSLLNLNIINKKLADRYNKQSYLIPHGLDEAFFKIQTKHHHQ